MAGITVAANNVVLRRIKLNGGTINNRPSSTCFTFTIEDSDIIGPPNSAPPYPDGFIKHGSYTANNVRMDSIPEGFRVGGAGSGCGRVTITNSWVRVAAPTTCNDWHGDGLQGYDGPAVTIRNTYLELAERGGCGGTAPFFYPRNQGNTSVDIDRLIVRGGGFSFRNGMPGRVTNLHIVESSYGYGPIDVRCSVITNWSASISRLTDGQPTVLRSQACNTESGF